MSHLPLHAGTHHTALDFGAPSRWAEHTFTHPALGTVPGKAFIGDLLGLTGAEISLGSLPPGAGIPFLHHHRQNEEIYLFLSGEGEFQVDGDIFPVQAGSVVRVSPAGLRGMRATGETPLVHLVIQVRAGSLAQATLADGMISPQAPAW